MDRFSNILSATVACIVAIGCSSAAPSAPSTEELPCSAIGIDAGVQHVAGYDGSAAGPLRILLYTYSTGFRHVSIPDGINAIRALASDNGFTVDVKGTEADGAGSYCENRPVAADAAYFTRENLARYAAVVFLSTTTPTDPGNPILDDAGKAAFEAYLRAGGGFVGVHAAADAEYQWPFYNELLGATFLAHGPPATSLVRIEDETHPATSGLPNPWSRFDEWYDFTPNPRPTAHVLMNLDEATYPNNPAPMGDHPIAWCKTVGAGRSFYSGLGHAGSAFADPLVRLHLLGGILYAAGAIPAVC